ncbi:MAG: response regulator transcription factor [Proteobacteria bacterium]|nr:response regulator transcription factor [Pseudomonadota bacterium]
MKQTILVLEDEPLILDEVRETLVDDGFNVLTAETAADFWALAENHRIDLFVLDLMLPDGNGLEIAKTLRQKSDVGIIILTGKKGETDRVVGLEIGADDYVTKPFSPRELSARVASVLRRTKGSFYPGNGQGDAGKAEVVEFAGWTLDLAARHLLAPGGGDVHLTTAEFELLSAFIEGPNRVHSRDYLMDRVHGRDWAGYDRGIDGVVSRLRKKLRSGIGEPDIIKTVRGAGYMFTPKVSSK